MMKSQIKDVFRKYKIRFLHFRTSRLPKIECQNPILILAPHPDDEAIGCGGLIARLCTEGTPPHVAVMTGGGSSMSGHSSAITSDDVITARRQLTLNSAQELGLPTENIHFLDFQDGGIAARPTDQIDRLRNLIREIKPKAILVPHHGEGWPDHLATREIGLELAKELVVEDSISITDTSTIGCVEPSRIPNSSFLIPNCNVSVWEYCVWMWYYMNWNLDWQNARVIHMTAEEHERKLKAVDAYIKPLAPNGKPWSGVLPDLFVKANTRRVELYFKLI